MPDTPVFLTRLGLDASADERAIRRAYARLLKQIDQETEPARFQCLREDYEQAIAWLSWRDAHDRDGAHDAGDRRNAGDAANVDDRHGAENSGDADDRHGAEDAGDADDRHRVADTGDADAWQQASNGSPGRAAASGNVQPAAPAPGTRPDAMFQSSPPVPIDPDALADEVYQHFLTALPRVRIAAMQDLGDGWDDDPWAEALRHCLADERLLNIAASTAFEARIVHLLAGPRQPDHEHLFNAAVVVFAWMSDPRRLEKFNHAGATVNRAIDERNMFNAQEVSERAHQQQAVHALHLPGLPAAEKLRALMPYVDTIMARFPVLMSMRVDPANVERWRARHAGTDGHVPPFAERARTTLKKLMQGQFPAFMVFAIILAIAVTYWSAPPDVMPVHRLPPPGVEAVTVVAVPLRALSEPEEASRRIRRHWPTAFSWLAPVRPQKVLVTQPHLDAIASRFDYKVDKQTPTGLRALELDVYLFEEGDVKLVRVARSSGDQRFDDAVKKAFRDTAPYPQWTAREFRLVYWATVTHRHLPGTWTPR